MLHLALLLANLLLLYIDSAMECKGPDDHACEVSTKEITSGRHLGGHMSCHRHADMQSKSTPRPPPTTVDLSVSLLGPSDEKPSLLSLETQCMQCFEEFSTCQSMRWDMRMYSEEKVTAKPDKEPAVLTEASAKANGDRWQNMMLFSPAKRKHQKHYLMECIMFVCTNSLKQLCFSSSCLLRLAIECI